jgi:hypothetical protein
MTEEAFKYMNKAVHLIGGLVVSAMMAGAATLIGAACNTTGGNAIGSNPSFSGVNVVCGNFATVNGGVPLGGSFTLLDAFIVFQNDYSLGAGGNATATFTWSNINPNFGPPAGFTDVVTGGFTSETYTPSVAPLYDPLMTGSCTTGAGFFSVIVVGGCATNPGAFLGAPATFTAATVSGTGSNLQTNGSIGVAAFIFYDYSAAVTGTTPEPGTLVLSGIALIGLAVLTRKGIRG